MTDAQSREEKEREETLRALMEMAWSVGFERVPIPPEKAGEARAILREHDARTVEAAMEAKAREVEEKLEAETRVGRTWVAAFLRNFRAPKGEKP